MRVCNFAKEPNGREDCRAALWSTFEVCRECKVTCYRQGWDTARAGKDNEGLVHLKTLERELHLEYEALPEWPDVVTRLQMVFVRLEDLFERGLTTGIYGPADPRLEQQGRIIESLRFVRRFYALRTQRVIDYDLSPPGRCYPGSRREVVRKLLERLT